MKTWALAVLLLGCADEPSLPNAAYPSAPTANDPSFQISGVKGWYLAGDALTPADPTVSISVTGDASTVDAYLAYQTPVRLTASGGTFTGELPIIELPPGEHDILLVADGASTAFAKVTFRKTAALYVMVSTDWDFSDPGNPSCDFTNRLHEDHHAPITQFVGPYTFTDPLVTPVRAKALAQFVIDNRDKYGDEIGLHIHPYCNFVTHSGLTCITDQSTVYASDDTGYTIKVAAYGRKDFATLLHDAKSIFEANGLGTPTLFRAGGWTADIETMKALEDEGFVGDSSALNWARIEEWKGKELYRWTQEHWKPIGDVSQPYYPNNEDVLSGAAPNVGVLEVPDNGVMIDYVSLAEMTGIFDANFNGTALMQPTTLMMGFHPSTSFSNGEYMRVDGFLSYADKHLASNADGPVIYTTLGKVRAAFAH